MRATLESADETGRIVLSTLEQLRSYCYVVAGIVGELITELFLRDAPVLARVEGTLVEHQLEFGEGLQLVNVLKDELEDAREGRSYLPAGVARSEILALARKDLVGARAYIGALESGGSPPGFIAFTSLAAELADATLLLLERDGAGSKVPRAEVMQLYARHQQASASGEVAHSPSAQSGK
jgi:farnesyl-diphosphate farnesyltransferase